MGENASQALPVRFRDMERVKRRTGGRSQCAGCAARRAVALDRARTAALLVECRSTLRGAGGVFHNPTGCPAASGTFLDAEKNESPPANSGDSINK